MLDNNSWLRYLARVLKRGGKAMATGSDQGQGNVSIVEIKCPSCNAPLQLRGDAETVACEYCGSTIHVSFKQQNTGIEPDGTVRDRTTGYGLFRMKTLPGWQVSGTALQRLGSSSRPYAPQVELRDRAGGAISVRVGDAGVRQSAGMKALMGMYGSQTLGIDTANYADVPDPLFLADMAASGVAANMGATNIRFLKQVPCPDMNPILQRGFASFQRMAQMQGAMVSGPFAAVVTRTYELTVDDQPWKMASFVTLSATKDGSGLGEGIGGDLMGGIGNLFGSIGNLFGGGQSAAQQPAAAAGSDPDAGVGGFLKGGGLIGKMQRDRQAAAQMPQQGAYGQPQQQYA